MSTHDDGVDPDGFHTHRDRRGLFVPLWVLDVVDNDYPTAILYAQVLWWHQPGLDGGRRARYRRDGHVWLLRADDEWNDECRLTIKQVRRSKKVLVDAGLVEVRRYKRSGAPTTAWRPIRPEPELPSEGQFQGSDPGGVVPTDPGGVVPLHTDQYQRGLPTQVDDSTSSTTQVEVVDRADVEDLCRHLADRIEGYHPERARPKVTDKWRRDMRLLVDRGPLGVDDPRPVPPAKVRSSIDVVFDDLAEPTGRGGFCWAAQIRSPGALRDHWSQLSEAWHRARTQPMSTRERRVLANGTDTHLAAVLDELRPNPTTPPLPALPEGPRP